MGRSYQRNRKDILLLFDPVTFYCDPVTFKSIFMREVVCKKGTFLNSYSFLECLGCLWTLGENSDTVPFNKKGHKK